MLIACPALLKVFQMLDRMLMLSNLAQDPRSTPVILASRWSYPHLVPSHTESRLTRVTRKLYNRHNSVRRHCSFLFGVLDQYVERSWGLWLTPVWGRHVGSGSSGPTRDDAELSTSEWHPHETPWAKNSLIEHPWVLDPWKLWDKLWWLLNATQLK